MCSKVAVVTGANKGIGLQIVKDLARKFDGLVYLTSRSPERGREALAGARKELGSPAAARLCYHQLDLTEPASIAAFAEFLKKKHGQINILVNNAGTAYTGASSAPFFEQVTVTNATNYYGTKAVCAALFPLLAPGARVVTVSSRGGNMALRNASPEIAAAFNSADSVAKVDELMERFISLAQTGEHKAAGFPDSAYGMSKLGTTAVALLQAKELAADASRPDIILNAMCPGYVSTDFSSHKGHLTVEQGADTAVWLALLPKDTPDNPVGAMLAERKVIDWRKAMTAQEAFNINANP